MRRMGDDAEWSPVGHDLLRETSLLVSSFDTARHMLGILHSAARGRFGQATMPRARNIELVLQAGDAARLVLDDNLRRLMHPLDNVSPRVRASADDMQLDDAEAVIVVAASLDDVEAVCTRIAAREDERAAVPIIVCPVDADHGGSHVELLALVERLGTESAGGAALACVSGRIVRLGLRGELGAERVSFASVAPVV